MVCSITYDAYGPYDMAANDMGFLIHALSYKTKVNEESFSLIKKTYGPITDKVSL